MNEPCVTIIVLTWNSKNDIDECLSSMLRQTYSNFSILIIDSCSTDGTVEHVRTHFPDVTVLELETNEGYRRGNTYGMQHAQGKYIVVCNDDVEVERNWLDEMVKVMEEDDYIGIVTPMILLNDHKELINTAGNTLHFSGMYGPRAKGEPKQWNGTRQRVAAVSGCCFMIRCDLMRRLGGFSNDFDQLDVGWHASFEDVDLSWRAQLMGYRIEYVPASIMYHKYKQPDLFPSRFGAYEWGRYLVASRNYSLFSLLILMPILFFQEISAWGYAFYKGKSYLSAKFDVMRWLLLHPRTLQKMRQNVQKLRKVPDYKVVRQMDSMLNLSRKFGGGNLAKVVDIFFRTGSFVYFQLFLCLLKVQTIFFRPPIQIKTYGEKESGTG